MREIIRREVHIRTFVTVLLVSIEIDLTIESLSLKGKAWRFSAHLFKPPSCDSPSKIPRHLVQLLAMELRGNKESIPSSALNNICPECCYFSICKGAKNALRCWEVHCCDQYQYGAMNLWQLGS